MCDMCDTESIPMIGLMKMSHENFSESLETQLKHGSKSFDDDLKPKNKGGYTRNMFKILCNVLVP